MKGRKLTFQHVPEKSFFGFVGDETGQVYRKHSDTAFTNLLSGELYDIEEQELESAELIPHWDICSHNPRDGVTNIHIAHCNRGKKESL